MINMMYRLQ